MASVSIFYANKPQTMDVFILQPMSLEMLLNVLHAVDSQAAPIELSNNGHNIQNGVGNGSAR